VYSRNRYGAYKRNRSVPVNPNTTRQSVIRAILSGLSIAWGQTLTQAQRDSWNVYGANTPWLNRLGQVVHLTGQAHYIRSNAPRLQCGMTRVDAAPTFFDLATPEQSLGCSASEATQLLSLSFDDTASWCSEDGAAEFIQVGIPQDPGIGFFNGPWRAVTCIEGDSGAPPASPVAPASPWAIAEGQRIWVRTRVGRADGRLSEFASYNFLCAA
jgi:hypothetical protein